MINLRCELCDEFLPIFQMSKLCPTCYKIRTIIKCYDNELILDHLTSKFINSDNINNKWEKKDGKWTRKKKLKAIKEKVEDDNEESNLD